MCEGEGGSIVFVRPRFDVIFTNLTIGILG